MRSSYLDITSRLRAAGRAFAAEPIPSASAADLGPDPPVLTGFATNPWLRFGAAVAVGYAAGSFNGASAVRRLSRRLLMFAATAVVRDVFRSRDY